MSTEVQVDDDSGEIVREFLIEADELVQTLNADFNQLESEQTDESLLNRIFRAAHTIKGIAGFLSFDRITTLTHSMEEVFNRLRKHELHATGHVVDVLYLALDTLKQLLDDVRAGNSEQRNIAQVLAELNAILLAEPLERSQQPELASTPVPEPAGKPTTPAERPLRDTTIRVNLDRLDTIMNLLSELVLCRNGLLQISSSVLSRLSVGSELETFGESVRSLDFLTNELQAAVMKTRMQPIGRLFSRFPRLVRDLMRESGKQVDLDMSGELTELDKSMIEEITDPLIHILRNACHHGIEMPTDRAESGKSARGLIRLNATQEGAYIIIRVTDDGRGLDTEAILRRIIERKLLSEAEARRLSESELARFILEPGFTTTRVVNDISGRGVGMDVVRTNVERLNGQIEIGSTRGVGTTITLRIPFSLAIIRGLVIEEGGEIFVLPLSSVRSVSRTDKLTVSVEHGRRRLMIHDEAIPLTSMSEFVTSERRSRELGKHARVAVIEAGGQRLALAFDRFYGREDVVVKPLDDYIKQSDLFAGATILGDGRVRMIIDVHNLIKLALA